MFTTFRTGNGDEALPEVQHSRRRPSSLNGPYHDACVACRQKKYRCSGEKTGCTRCRSHGKKCVYVGNRYTKRASAVNGAGAQPVNDASNPEPRETSSNKTSNPQTSQNCFDPPSTAVSRDSGVDLSELLDLTTDEADSTTIGRDWRCSGQGWSPLPQGGDDFFMDPLLFQNGPEDTLSIDRLQSINLPFVIDTGIDDRQQTPRNNSTTGDRSNHGSGASTPSRSTLHVRSNSSEQNRQPLEHGMSTVASTNNQQPAPTTSSRHSTTAYTYPNEPDKETWSVTATQDPGQTCRHGCTTTALHHLEIAFSVPQPQALPGDIIRFLGTTSRSIPSLSLLCRCTRCTQLPRFVLLLAVTVEKVVDALSEVMELLVDRNIDTTQARLVDYGVETVEEFVGMFSPVMLPIIAALKGVVKKLKMRGTGEKVLVQIMRMLEGLEAKVQCEVEMLI